MRKSSVGNKVLVIHYADHDVFVKRYEETLISLKEEGFVVTECQFSTNHVLGSGIYYAIAIFYNPPETKTDK